MSDKDKPERTFEVNHSVAVARFKKHQTVVARGSDQKSSRNNQTSSDQKNDKGDN